jgi:hypothetical protein
MLVSLIFSIINFLVDVPILLNLIVDIVLTATVFPSVFFLLDSLPDSFWCQIRFNYPYPGENLPHPKCKDWKLAVTILMGTAATFGGIIGYVLFFSRYEINSPSLKHNCLLNQILTNGSIVLFMWLCWCFEVSRFSEPNFGGERSPSQRGEPPLRLA